MPKAEFFPSFELDRTETPTDVNPLGVKGAGETGTIASTPAVVNAVVDALAPLGITHIDMPLTPGARLAGHRAGEGLREEDGCTRHVRPSSPTTGPRAVDEAVALLAELEDSRPLAGGHSLLPAMKLRFSTPAALVDIGRIAGLDGIEQRGRRRSAIGATRDPRGGRRVGRSSAPTCPGARRGGRR